MNKRRGPFKITATLPDEDTESGSERESAVKREDAEGSDSSFEASSSEVDSDAEMTRDKAKRKNDSSSSSSSSSNEESASIPSSSDESELEEEKPRKKKIAVKKKIMIKKKTSTTKMKKSDAKRLKRLKRMSASGSSDDDSEVEVTQSLKQKNSVKVEDDEDTEDEMDIVKEEALGSDTDSEENWQSQPQDEETDAKPRKKRDGTVEDSDEEWCKDEWEDEDMPTEDEDDEEVGNADVTQAKFVMRNITSHVPLIEETAIRRGVKLSGPPLEFATTHLDEYARKFRWPQHVRNLRNTDFSQDPSEILEDYEVLTDVRQPEPDSSEQGVSKESAFAQVPRPMVALAAEALRRSFRKRKRIENREEPNEYAPSAAGLLNIARIGEQFGDHFVDSLLSANGKALQGILDSDFDYDKRCWSSLPAKKKPIANWRFVLEHVRRTKGRTEADDVVYPPMKQKTLNRITKRLKKLYGHTTQHEEYDVFAGSTTNAAEITSEDQTNHESE